MIKYFSAEFLLHPCALDYSGNTCSHNCFYCFANIKKKERHANLRQTYNLLSGKSKSNTITNALLKLGYAICVSNRSDPFSDNNYKFTLPVLQMLAKRENGIFFQTKGGKGIDDALKILKNKDNVIWYITITSLSEKISRQIEPNAPLPIERIKLAKKLKQNGQEVIIAINPCEPEWMPEKDMRELEDRMAEIDVFHYVFQPLHISRIMMAKKELPLLSEEKKQA